MIAETYDSTGDEQNCRSPKVTSPEVVEFMIQSRQPQYNSTIESFNKTIKAECLEKLILTSEAQLRYVIREYLEYYNHEHPHSGLGGKMIDPRPQPKTEKIVRCTWLGGLLNTYVRVAEAA